MIQNHQKNSKLNFELQKILYLTSKLPFFPFLDHRNMTAMNDPEMVGRLNGLNHQLLHQSHHSTPAAVPPTATATVAESAAAILENVNEVTIQSTQNSNEENHSTINSEDSARVSLNSGCRHDGLFSVDSLILETILKQF